MAKQHGEEDGYASALGRFMLAIVILFLLAFFLIWRIDSPRVERVRMQIIDSVIPNFEWATAPLTAVTEIASSFQSYARIYEQNQELRRELLKMKIWEERARQFEQENARLLDLNNVRLDPQNTFVTGVVLADSGGPFRQTVLLNVGARDGIQDGWAVLDGLGLVGRISGVAERTSRVILLGDTASQIAVTIAPSGQRAMILGDNSVLPPIEFLEKPDLIRAGDRVFTSGDGGVFPQGLLVGQVVQSSTGRLRVNLAADIQRLEFLRVVRNTTVPTVESPGSLLGTRPLAREDQDGS